MPDPDSQAAIIRQDEIMLQKALEAGGPSGDMIESLPANRQDTITRPQELPSDTQALSFPFDQSVTGIPLDEEEPSFPFDQSVTGIPLDTPDTSPDTIQSNRFVQNSQITLLRQDRSSGSLPETLTPQEDPSSEMILSARGTVYLVKLSANYGPGLYAIDDLTREVIAPDSASKSPIRAGVQQGDAGNLINSKSPILITGIEFNQSDIVSQMPCLNNFKVFYSFGQNFGQVVITGEVLLGPLGDVNVDGVNRVVDFFWKYRVSERHLPIAVSVAWNAYFVYLTGMRIGQIDPQFHVMPFVMIGTLLDIKRETTASINLPGRVINGGSLNDPTLFRALINPSMELKFILLQLGDIGKAIKEKVADVATSLADSAASLFNALKIGAANPVGQPGNATAVKIKNLNTHNAVTQNEKTYALLKQEQDRRKIERQIVGADFSDIPPVPTVDDEKLDNAVRYAGIMIVQDRPAVDPKTGLIKPPSSTTVPSITDADRKNFDEQLDVVASGSINRDEAASIMPDLFTETAIKERAQRIETQQQEKAAQKRAENKRAWDMQQRIPPSN